MFDDVPDGSRIKIGRIAFLVLSALPLAIAIHLLSDDPVDKHERLVNMLFGFIMIVLSSLLAVIGTTIVIRKITKGETILFWLCSTIVVALPEIYIGIQYLFWMFRAR